SRESDGRRGRLRRRRTSRVVAAVHDPLRAPYTRPELIGTSECTAAKEDTMTTKRTKSLLPVPAPPEEVSSADLTALTNAYKAGLIVGWRRDTDRGYRVTRAGQPDEYVEISKLASYLEKL